MLASPGALDSMGPSLLLCHPGCQGTHSTNAHALVHHRLLSPPGLLPHALCPGVVEHSTTTTSLFLSCSMRQ